MRWVARIALLLSAAPAWATRPGEWVVGLQPSYTYIVLQQRSQPKGGGGLLFVQYGLTSAVALHLSASWSGHGIEAAGKDPGGVYQVINGAIGFRYAFDFVSINPAIEGGLGVLHHRYQRLTETNLGLQLGVSLDYWLLPWLSVGAAFHYHAYLSNPTEYPVYFDAGPRVGVRWP